MKTSSLVSVFGATALAAIACCGGSSLDNSTKLVSLSSADQNTLCMNEASAIGSARMVTCGSGSDTFTLTIGGQTIAACVAGLMSSIQSHPNCPATVGDAQGCFDAEAAMTDAQWCNQTSSPAACAVLDGSACAGSAAGRMF